MTGFPLNVGSRRTSTDDEERVHVDVQDRAGRSRSPSESRSSSSGPVRRRRTRSRACCAHRSASHSSRGSRTHGELADRCSSCSSRGHEARIDDDAVRVVRPRARLRMQSPGAPRPASSIPARARRPAPRRRARPLASRRGRSPPRPHGPAPRATPRPPRSRRRAVLQSMLPSRRRFCTSSSPSGLSIRAPPTSQSRTGPVWHRP